MTANQLVAYNLRRIRERDNLTQERAAKMLKPFLGQEWSKATFSAAETSVTSGRVREFTANEILAFSAAFGVPVGWFFLPPDRDEDAAKEAVSAGGSEKLRARDLVHAVAPVRNPPMLERFSAMDERDRNVGLDRVLSAVTSELLPTIANALMAPPDQSAFARLALAASNKEEEDNG